MGKREKCYWVKLESSSELVNFSLEKQIKFGYKV